ncbi:hypothetical protein [uncultured Bosea sp.]|uniref:hypothetical protein n=1 Tax=uncultured Bosea sp. TaxID=211457 RepID=UPI0025EBE127|nr:hypothetical protein [uncultured Bosea sp.]
MFTVTISIKQAPQFPDGGIGRREHRLHDQFRAGRARPRGREMRERDPIALAERLGRIGGKPGGQSRSRFRVLARASTLAAETSMKCCRSIMSRLPAAYRHDKKLTTSIGFINL